MGVLLLLLLLPVTPRVDRAIPTLLADGISVMCDSGSRKLLLCLLRRRLTTFPQYVMNNGCTCGHPGSMCGGWSEDGVGVLGHTRACMGRASTTAAGR